MKRLTRQEEMVLLAVYRLQEEASLVSIRHFLNSNTGQRIRMSSVYILLDRLTKADILLLTIGDPTPVRGGRARKFYRLSPSGMKALAQAQKLHKTLWEGLPDLGKILKHEN